ncbi:hypothetical protein HBI23_190780 [Parastagonospora nodorum]|nr:hypothetical protein HBH51_183790 [Parastagonospora nodorum]KAH4061603.1 hypothetical protein HBH50_218170 [Parastagonospora nodorum]KAH4080139.1 hypothetical protein HBH48_212280 [Parastagonospora nodorum]KAH4978692.1 hypothetical protein HBI76_204190 [Parastagonospora nodorum]KAH5402835.1 hypothetical protein HBI47_186930 [Parastagonospora nodorum]
MHLAAPRHIRTRPPFPSQLLPAAPHAIRITAKPPTITPKKAHPSRLQAQCLSTPLYRASHNARPSVVLGAAPPPPPSQLPHHGPQPPTYNNTNTNYHHGAAAAAEAESYEARQRREEAGRILEREEMLIWWSQARNESVPQTRTHFRNIVLGIEERADVVWREEWELEKDAVGASPRGKERERDKGKRRVVSGTRE